MTTSPTRVLLVDGDAGALRKLHERLAAVAGLDVSAALIKEALGQLAARRFDAVLLGIRRHDARPGDTVAQLAAAAKAPVIVILHEEDEQVEQSLFAAGAQDVWATPVASDPVIVRSLKAAVLRHVALAQMAQSMRQAQGERTAATARRASTLAHDIDNPASFILANQSMLKDDLVKLGIVFASLRGYMAEEADSDRRAILDAVLPREALDNILRDMKEMLDDNNIGVSRIRALTRDLRNLATEPDEPAAAPKRKLAVSRPPRAKILIVDDEPALLKVYRRMLEPLHEVVTALGGAEALAILKSAPDFDVVVCDLTMPGVDGPAVHEAVSSSAPELAERFVFCTGGAFTTQTRDFIARVDNLFLEKPITRDKLLAAVDRVRGGVSQAPASQSSSPPSS